MSNSFNFSSFSRQSSKGILVIYMNLIFKGIKFAFNGKPLFVQNGQLNWESRTAYLVLTTDLEVGKIKQNNVEV